MKKRARDKSNSTGEHCTAPSKEKKAKIDIIDSDSDLDVRQDSSKHRKKSQDSQASTDHTTVVVIE